MSARDRVDLSEAEVARIRALRARVDDLMPEARPFVKGLVAAGLIAGWRNLTGVYPPGESPTEQRAVMATPLAGDAFCEIPKEEKP